jgi:hypothetical protein
MQVDIDISSRLPFSAKFAVIGDFDGDGRQEIAVAPDAPGSRGNDFWVMKFDTASRTWAHLSPIAGHPMQADIDFSVLRLPVRFAVAGDFDGDGQQEIVAAPEAGGSEGNDLWVVKFDSESESWAHLSPMEGHPVEADIDLTTLGFPAKFAVVGDFDGDGQQEIAVAPDAAESAGNDLWVMKFESGSRAWRHLSSIVGHPMEADMDLTIAAVPAAFAVVGDFDGDGRDEIVLAPEADGSQGNDFWAMKFHTSSRTWRHLSPIGDSPLQADMDLTTLKVPGRFATVGDFDGDGRPELVIAPRADGSAGNDFWAMKFDVISRRWTHLSPIDGHPMEADIDMSVLGVPARFAVAGDFDGDGRDEIAVELEAAGSAGNDFWVVKFDPASRTWAHLSPIRDHPNAADIDIRQDVPVRFSVAGDFDGDGRHEIAAAIDSRGPEGNDFWVMKFDTASRTWAHLGSGA